jgi:hypothetical protein
MIDILYLAKNRLEFTRGSLLTLRENTNWALVRRLILFDDGSEDGTAEHLDSCGSLLAASLNWDRNVEVAFVTAHPAFGSPVKVMQDYLRIWKESPIFAKIDNDVIVPPGWLDQCMEVMEQNPDLGLLGIEPPDSRKPHFSQPGRPQLTRELERAAGPARYVPCDAIGGIGLMRRSAFDGRDQMIPHSIYGGFTDWQLRNPEVKRGWIAPALKLFLLDRLPIEPFKSLSEQYIAKGWQRKWRDYDMRDSHLWEWWVN